MDKSHIEISKDEALILIIAEKNERKIIVDENELKWEEDEIIDGIPIGYLTLAEIGRQLKELGYKETYYVCHETPLKGVIYQYGNYKTKEWIEHGKTKGFA